jgi:hypothetical protein
MWLSVSAEWNVFDRWSLLDHSLPTLFAPSRRVAVGRQLTNAHETLQQLPVSLPVKQRT